MERKVVCLPIKVPVGKYCWCYNIPGVCDYFDNEGGTSSCTLGFNIKDTKNGVLKDQKCEKLINIQ